MLRSLLQSLSRIALALTATAASAPVHAQAPGPSGPAPVALVIANSDYAGFPKLPTCATSSNLVAAALTRAGFKVVRQDNPSNARLGTAIATLGDDAAAAGASLIYLCGYAVTYADRLFVLPAEARLERDADLLSQGIVARQLMAAAAPPGASAGLVVMDLATPPDKGPLAFDSMLRPSDAAHGGLVAAALPADAQRPAVLATALADLVGSGTLEVGNALRSLQTQPDVKPALLAVRPAIEPSWLLSRPAAPADKPVAEASAPAGRAPAAAALPPGSVTLASPAAATAAPDLTPADRRRLQLALQRLNYFKGRIDGVFGSETQAAIRQFQRDSKADPTGTLTAHQVEQLLQ